MKNLILKYLIPLIRRKDVLYETVQVIGGYYIYNRKRFYKNTTIFLRGATGDIYLQFLLLKSYIRDNNLKNYVLIGDSGNAIAIARLFGYPRVSYMSPRAVSCLEKYYLFMGGNNQKIVIPFCWSDNYFFNTCCVRMTNKFSFMENYYYFSFVLNPTYQFQLPQFDDVDEKLTFYWQQLGIIKGKTVIISPDANSVTGLPIWFWNSIIQELRTMGYAVFMNCNYPTYYRAPNLFPSYSTCVPLLEYAGYFIGIRSGFCDIVSSAKCKKVIIYPEIGEKIDYVHHRSDYAYSSLRVMRLCERSDLYEIITPLIQNITDEKSNIEGVNSYVASFEILRTQIISKF